MRFVRRIRDSAVRGLLVLLGALGALGEPAQAATEALAQERRIAVKVTAVRGRDVYLDAGRAAGLVADDVVVFHVAGHGEVQAVLRSVSSHNARAELPAGAPAISEGTEGFVPVPSSRLAEEPEEEPPEETAWSAPEHPPWEHPPEQWSNETPLLAPAFGRRPEERDVRFTGRVFTQFDGAWDRLRDTSATLGRAGIRMDVRNPFGRAGRIRVDAQANHRRFTGAGPNAFDSELWFNRLSYAHGDTADATDRWEVGRFLQKEFPELQVLDGAEYSHTTEGGNRVGASVGGMPAPFPGLPDVNDLQASVFYRHFLGDSQQLALGGAYQSTWHEGVADRNLFLAELEYTPSSRTWLRSIAWIDYYTAGDAIKDTGFELTELQVQGGGRIGDATSVSATFQHRRWPELRREEFQSVDPERLRSSQVDRAWVSAFTDLSDPVRVRGLFGIWEDQDDSGGNFELGVVLTDLLWDRGQLDLAVYGSGGAFTSIEPGLRVAASRSFRRCSLLVSFDTVDFLQEDFVGNQETLLQQALQASFDWTLTPDWSLSFYAVRRFGEEQDAYGGGFILQRRF